MPTTRQVLFDGVPTKSQQLPRVPLFLWSDLARDLALFVTVLLPKPSAGLCRRHAYNLLHKLVMSARRQSRHLVGSAVRKGLQRNRRIFNLERPRDEVVRGQLHPHRTRRPWWHQQCDSHLTPKRPHPRRHLGQHQSHLSRKQVGRLHPTGSGRLLLHHCSLDMDPLAARL